MRGHEYLTSRLGNFFSFFGCSFSMYSSDIGRCVGIILSMLLPLFIATVPNYNHTRPWDDTRMIFLGKMKTTLYMRSLKLALKLWHPGCCDGIKWSFAIARGQISCFRIFFDCFVQQELIFSLFHDCDFNTVCLKLSVGLLVLQGLIFVISLEISYVQIIID